VEVVWGEEEATRGEVKEEEGEGRPGLDEGKACVVEEGGKEGVGAQKRAGEPKDGPDEKREGVTIDPAAAAAAAAAPAAAAAAAAAPSLADSAARVALSHALCPGVRTFSGCLRNSYVCRVCHHETQLKEPFTHLSLQVGVRANELI
jgi:hypothetical protein